uniref:Retrotransposon Gag domain, retroviral aspartyl protease n=1 Tax=Tanacetum cinerariifolium TaxID=118510 RepID=A0A6L2KH90_TANCI|nr:retrotransposon Gag domain, retroviral aspartyl protease [Tanacetum cinerariifolium]
MVQTWNSENNNPPDPIATQLAAIAAKLEAIETMKVDIAALKEGDRSRSKGSKNFNGESFWRGRQSYRPHNKIDFSNFSGGDPRGWLLKAEKYFRGVPKWPKDELKLDVRIHKPRTVLEANEDVEEPLTTDLTNLESDREETPETSSTHNFISDVLVNELKLATQPLAPFGVQISNEDVIRCGQICKNLPVHINDLKITQDFHHFSLGGVDLVLGIQWLATLNMVQANWKELFMIFSIDGKQYKLEGIVTVPQKSFGFQHLAVEPEVIPCIPAPLQPIITQYTTIFEEPQHLPLLDHKPIQFYFCQTPPHLISVLTATSTP